jgi:cytoskeleton protein RodZ
MAEIGSTLREARMRAHIDISEVEASTKIRAKYLRAIENEEWDLLPGTVYVKSFLRTYGDYLGLDSRLLIDEFKRRYERPVDHEARPISAVGRERERSSRRRTKPSFSFSPRLVIGAALAVIVVALYVIGSNIGSPSTPSGRVITPSGTGTTTHTGKHGGTGTRGSHGRTTTSTSTTTTGTTTTTAPTKATLQLVATGTVWVCVEGPAKKVLVPARDYAAGEKIPAVSARKLWVALGNADVTATVNGKPYTFTSTVAPIGLTITAAAGAKSIASPPTCA